MTQATARPGAHSLRMAVLILAGLETALVAVMEFLVLGQAIASNEQLGRSIGWAVAAAIGAPFVLLTLPALVLALLGRWLRLALLLAILAVAVPVTMRFLS